MKECPVIRTRFEDDPDFEPIDKDDIEKSTEYYSRNSEPTSIKEILQHRMEKGPSDSQPGEKDTK